MIRRVSLGVISIPAGALCAALGLTWAAAVDGISPGNSAIDGRGNHRRPRVVSRAGAVADAVSNSRGSSRSASRLRPPRQVAADASRANERQRTIASARSASHRARKMASPYIDPARNAAGTCRRAARKAAAEASYQREQSTAIR